MRNNHETPRLTALKNPKTCAFLRFGLPRIRSYRHGSIRRAGLFCLFCEFPNSEFNSLFFANSECAKMRNTWAFLGYHVRNSQFFPNAKFAICALTHACRQKMAKEKPALVAGFWKCQDRGMVTSLWMSIPSPCQPNERTIFLQPEPSVEASPHLHHRTMPYRKLIYLLRLLPIP